MKRDEPIYELQVAEVLRASDKACQVLTEDGEEVWLPKSQIENEELPAPGKMNFTLNITRWIARQKDLPGA